MYALLTFSLLGTLLVGCGSSPQRDAATPRFAPDSTVEHIDAPYDQVALQVVEVAKSMGWRVIEDEGAAGTVIVQIPEQADSRLYFFLKRDDGTVRVTARTDTREEATNAAIDEYFGNLKERFHGILPAEQGVLKKGNQDRR